MSETDAMNAVSVHHPTTYALRWKRCVRTRRGRGILKLLVTSSPHGTHNREMGCDNHNRVVDRPACLNLYTARQFFNVVVGSTPRLWLRQYWPRVRRSTDISLRPCGCADRVARLGYYSMTRYRARPREVEAVQWFKYGDHPSVQECCERPGINHGTLRSHGDVLPSNWIVTDATGDRVVKAYPFAEQFEEIGDE